MQSIVALIFIFGYMRCDILNIKGSVFDTVGVTANNRAVICVDSLGVVQVVFCVVIAKYDVLRGTIFIIDKKTSQTCTVGYKCCINAWCIDCILLEMRRVGCNDG